MSRFLLVELEEDLGKHYTTRTGVWCRLKEVNGVKAITDVSVISRQTLDEWLLPEDQVLLPARTRRPRRNGAT